MVVCFCCLHGYSLHWQHYKFKRYFLCIRQQTLKIVISQYDSLRWRSFLKLWHQRRGIFSLVTTLRAQVVVLIPISLQGRAMVLPNPRSLLRYSFISRARILSLIEPISMYTDFSHTLLFSRMIYFFSPINYILWLH